MKQQQQNNNHIEKIPTFIPFMVQLCFYLFSTLFLLDVMLPSSSSPYTYLCCQIDSIIHRYQVWRIVTGFMCQESTIVFVIIMVQMLTVLHKFVIDSLYLQECRNGSAAIIVQLAINYTAISFFVVLGSATVYFIHALFMHYFSSSSVVQDKVEQTSQQIIVNSVWPVTPGLLLIHMNILTKYCFYNSQVTVRSPIVVPYFFNNDSNNSGNIPSHKFKLKYYAYVSYVIVIMISVLGNIIFGNTAPSTTSYFVIFCRHYIRLDGLVGLILAQIQCRFLNGGFILYTKQTYTEKQKIFTYCYVTESELWVPCNPEYFKVNNRQTVNSSQFYINLAEWGSDQKWNTYKHQKLSENGFHNIRQLDSNQETQYFKGTGTNLQ